MARRNGLKTAEVQRMTNTLLSAMCDTFQEGDAVQLPNFGVLEVRKKLERIVVNPASGQRMLVPPKLTLCFKPTPTVKDRFKKGGGNG